MNFDKTETLILSILAYILGVWITRRVRWIKAASIPEPITGGLIFVLVMAVPEFLGYPIRMTLDLRDTLLLAFFATVGLEAKLERLIPGGKVLLTIAGLAILMLPIQNLIGAGVALLMGEPPLLGIISGSVSMSGGAGTAIAWAPVFEAHGIDNAMGIGLAAASFGLIIGSALGGPVGKSLISRYRLRGGGEETESLFAVHEDQMRQPCIDADGVLRSIGNVAVVILAGYYIDLGMLWIGFDIPLFVSVILSGGILTNVAPAIFPRLSSPASKPPLVLISDVSLNIFLAMSILGISLPAVFHYFKLLIVIILVQAVVVVAYTWLVVFRSVGRNYDAAVMSAGFIGLELGATPNAMACMTVLTRKYGESPRAILTVPLIGLFLFDFFNSIFIKVMIGWFS